MNLLYFHCWMPITVPKPLCKSECTGCRGLKFLEAQCDSATRVRLPGLRKELVITHADDQCVEAGSADLTLFPQTLGGDFHIRSPRSGKRPQKAFPQIYCLDHESTLTGPSPSRAPGKSNIRYDARSHGRASRSHQ